MTKQGWYILIRTVLIGIVIAFCLLSLPSCKTQTVVVERVQKEYVHDTISRVDSVWRDRVHTEYQRGDTIILRDSVYLYKYKTIDKVVERITHDSIPYTVEVEKQVRYVPGFYKFCMWFFIAVCVVFGMWLFVKIGNRVWLRK